jgi:uncharacterized protein YndB with AHSA1/START domain
LDYKNDTKEDGHMNNLTKMKILKPAHEIFEAIVDPVKIGNYWFTSSSERWEAGKAITLRYEEYNAEGVMQVVEVIENQKIVFQWGAPEEIHTITFILNEIDSSTTILEVNEEGFLQDDPQLLAKMLDNKEGWVYMLSCLKAYLETGMTTLRASLIKG